MNDKIRIITINYDFTSLYPNVMKVYNITPELNRELERQKLIAKRKEKLNKIFNI